MDRTNKFIVGGVSAIAATGLAVALGVSTLAAAAPDDGPRRPPVARRGDGPAGMQLGMPIHGEGIVKKDGKFITVVRQLGDVTANSPNSITVKSEDGFEATYVVSSSTKVRQGPGDESVDEIKAGDKVAITGIKEGDSVTAVVIRSGDRVGQGPGGRGMRHRGEEGPHEDMADEGPEA